MKRKRILMVVGVLIALMLACVLLAPRLLPNPAAAQSRTPTETGTVTRTTLTSVIESTGSVLPQSEVALSFNTAGTVMQVPVSVGDHVKQGDVLAQLDTTSLQLAVDKAQQAVVQQEATYRQTVKPTTTSIKSAQAAVDSAAAAHAAAQQQAAQRNNKITTQCAEYNNAKAALDRAQTA